MLVKYRTYFHWCPCWHILKNFQPMCQILLGKSNTYDIWSVDECAWSCVMSFMHICARCSIHPCLFWVTSSSVQRIKYNMNLTLKFCSSVHSSFWYRCLEVIGLCEAIAGQLYIYPWMLEIQFKMHIFSSNDSTGVLHDLLFNLDMYMI